MPKPHPSTGEALIRVTLAGICNTDIGLIDARPLVTAMFPAHEAGLAFNAAKDKKSLKILIHFS